MMTVTTVRSAHHTNSGISRNLFGLGPGSERRRIGRSPTRTTRQRRLPTLHSQPTLQPRRRGGQPEAEPGQLLGEFGSVEIQASGRARARSFRGGRDKRFEFCGKRTALKQSPLWALKDFNPAGDGDEAGASLGAFVFIELAGASIHAGFEALFDPLRPTRIQVPEPLWHFFNSAFPRVRQRWRDNCR